MIADKMRLMVAVTMSMTMRRFFHRPASLVGMQIMIQMRFGGEMKRNEMHPQEELHGDQETQPPTRRTGPAAVPE